MKQLFLLKPAPLSCGGSLENTRHQKRTLSFKKPLHLVLKSKKPLFFKHRGLVLKTLKTQAGKAQVQLDACSVQKDHLHLCIRLVSRDQYKKFIRAVTGLLARRLGRGLFSSRPFTRVTQWGRDLRNLRDYIFQNEMEVWGLWEYRRREQKKESVKRDIKK